MFNRFKKLVLGPGNEVLERFQDNVAAAIGTLPDVPTINGRLIRNISLKAGTVSPISHQLGRFIVGWQIVRIRGNANVWDEQDTNVTPTLTLNLTTDTDIKIDIWVF